MPIAQSHTALTVEFSLQQVAKDQRGSRDIELLVLTSALDGGGWSTPRPGEVYTITEGVTLQSVLPTEQLCATLTEQNCIRQVPSSYLGGIDSFRSFPRYLLVNAAVTS